MKQLYLVIMLCFALLSKAQPYESVFGHYHTGWNVYSFNLGTDRTDSLYVDGDTSIAAITYQKIYKTSRSGTAAVMGYLHEDSAGGKLTYRSLLRGSEDVVMDLNLQVGDSFLLRRSSDSTYLHVDSVYMAGGKKHVRFFESHSFPEPLEMIEGVGPAMGINFMEYFLGMQYVLCAYKDSVQTYGTGPCYVNHSAIADQADPAKQIHVFPNPAQGYFSIRNEGNLKVEASIFTVTGQCVASLPVEAGEAITSQLQEPGLYIVLLKTTSEGYVYKKLLIR